MAYAAYCDQFRTAAAPRFDAQAVATLVVQRAASRLGAGARKVAVGFVVMTVTVACADAPAVRRAIASCRDCGVLRCIPELQDGQVRLEVRLPDAMRDTLMHQVIACVPTGEFGRVTPWATHLARHQVQHRVG